MRRLFAITLMLCLTGVAFALETRGHRRQVLQAAARDQRLVLASGEVWLETPSGRRSLGLARYHPWKLAWAQVAGRRQLAVGVFKSTRFEPQPHNALFLYDWGDGKLTPRWLGSRLSKPFLDFAFADMRGVGETELLSVERLADERLCVVIYRWTGFGFEGCWQSPPFDSLTDLVVAKDRATAVSKDGGKGRVVSFGWLGNAYGELTQEEGVR